MWSKVQTSSYKISKQQGCNFGEGNGNPLQYSCLENPMDGGAWWAAVQGVVKSQTRLSDFTFTFHFHALEKEMATHSSVLAGQSQGWWSLVGCHLRGCTELDMTEVTQQQQQGCNVQHDYSYHCCMIYKKVINKVNSKHSPHQE